MRETRRWSFGCAGSSLIGAIDAHIVVYPIILILVLSLLIIFCAEIKGHVDIGEITRCWDSSWSCSLDRVGWEVQHEQILGFGFELRITVGQEVIRVD
jgi:hypothetical protein